MSFRLSTMMTARFCDLEAGVTNEWRMQADRETNEEDHIDSDCGETGDIHAVLKTTSDKIVR